jgi:hypothetical protein
MLAMALKTILLLLGTLNAEAVDSNAAAKAMSKFVQVPATRMAHPASSVDNGATFATASDAMLVADLERQSQEMKAEYQHLRARIEKLSQADVNASISAPSSFRWFAALIASLGLATTMGVAAVKKYMGQGQQALETITGAELPTTSRGGSPVMQVETKADLEVLAQQCNPIVGFWDPLNCLDFNFWGLGNEATIGYLRHAEIKHGRVAMAAFLGYWVQSTDLVAGPHKTLPFRGFEPGLTPPEQWDAIPLYGKLQIIVFVGRLESYGEILGPGQHYTQGGKPGYYPPIKGKRPELVFNLYDPFNFFDGMTEEEKAAGRVKEINNGRLAMLGIFSLISEATVPGSVPLLPLGGSASWMIPEYDGNVMVPFSGDFTIFG